MTIFLSDAGKRYNREWIFRHLTYTFEQGKSYAIIGPNGSGKSTLLQVMSGAVHFNEGTLNFETGDGSQEAGVVSRESIVDTRATLVPAERMYEHIAICAPYLEVVEEMTLKEFLDFHHGFKPFLSGITIEKIVSIIGMERAMNKQIRYYSSGMKQRVKLAQCIFSNVPVILLDEPCTNLDSAGIELYHQLISDYCKDRLVVVSSNDEVEYRFCQDTISIMQYK